MHSPNKRAQTAAERRHAARIAGMPCQVCKAPPPSEVHEVEQGLWFLSIPLCADCHRGGHNGLHGQRRMWAAMKMTELSALNEALRQVLA